MLRRRPAAAALAALAAVLLATPGEPASSTPVIAATGFAVQQRRSSG